jgi:hypothetical protein
MLDPSQDDDCLLIRACLGANSNRATFSAERSYSVRSLSATTAPVVRVARLDRILCRAPIVLGYVGFIAKPLNPGD